MTIVMVESRIEYAAPPRLEEQCPLFGSSYITQKLARCKFCRIEVDRRQILVHYSPLSE